MIIWEASSVDGSFAPDSGAALKQQLNPALFVINQL
jgi:hypothetical protein